MNNLKGIFLHNLPVKIVALFAAGFLWAFVMNDQNPPMEKVFSVTVAVLNAPGESLVTQSEETVKMKLRAPRSVFASMDPDEVKAFVDLAGLEAGIHPLHVHSVIPQGIEVLSISPDVVNFTIDPIIQKRMPVRIVRSGKSPDGLTVSGIEPDTRTVTVVGPQSVLERVAEVVGVVYVPGDAAGDVDVEAEILAVDEDGEVVERARVVPKLISAHISFARSLSRKVVEVKPVTNGTVAEGYVLGEVRSDPARVELAGSVADIEKITSLSTEPVFIAGLKESAERSVSLVLPEGVTVTNKNVTVHVEIKEK